LRLRLLWPTKLPRGRKPANRPLRSTRRKSRYCSRCLSLDNIAHNSPSRGSNITVHRRLLPSASHSSVATNIFFLLVIVFKIIKSEPHAFHLLIPSWSMCPFQPVIVVLSFGAGACRRWTGLPGRRCTDDFGGGFGFRCEEFSLSCDESGIA
jgi:hypothetical protein